MADPTDTTGGTGTTAAAPAATSVPGTTDATTGAATDGGSKATEAGQAGANQTGAGKASAAPPLDTILAGLKTLAAEVVSLSLPSLSLQLVLPLADASKASLALYLTPPAQPTTSGTAPKGGCLDDVLGAVRTAVNDSATFGETMVVEGSYVCVTSLQRT